MLYFGYFYNRLYPIPLVDCASEYPMDDARERKSTKAIDSQESFIKPKILPCFCQSTILGRGKKYKFARLTYNFSLMLAVWITAINTQLIEPELRIGLHLQIHKLSVDRKRLISRILKPTSAP